MIRIHHVLLAACALLLAVAAAAAQGEGEEWRTDVPCTAGADPALTVAAAPVEAAVPGCARASCVALPGGRRVCACAGDTAAVMRLEADGRLVQQWPGHDGFAGSPFRVMEGDLDADGRAELVVAQLVTVSNGLAIAYHDLRIVDGRDAARAPIRLTVEDFDPAGAFVRPRGGGPCRLLATRWTGLRDPRRGEGMYFTGQWMRYRQGRLEHDPGRPAVARRLLHDLDRDVPAAPFALLRDRRAQAWGGFPATLPPLAGSRSGTVMRVKADTVDVAYTPHEIAVFAGVNAEGEWDEERGAVSSYLVDAATGRPYPPGYQVPDPAWLQLAPVTVRTYRDGDGTVHLLLVGPERRATGIR